MPLTIKVKDHVILKKQHPCGGNTFEVMRAGMDFRIRCTTGNAQIWLTRPDLEKRIKKIEPNQN